MTWMCRQFSELSSLQLYDVLQLRAAIFVVEQDCPYQDIDGLDLHPETRHVLHYNSQGELLAYLRILAAGVSYPDVAIGRVVTAASARGQGLGHQLLDRGINAAKSVWPAQDLYLSAQAHLQHYYQRYDFVTVTAEYLEDGIPHVGMRSKASAERSRNS
ncbi:GNAT family N-acetyltransferase [Moritella sp. F3]|uniref:GNAT family N-acetyltransferase n=1 Tax=Moritella sp. F3 TaxID=2718882 RepID=UPI0018E169C1|nr:GNAT family N-acetyltransferase [Moritella sp. F3]GIC76322.1 GNAT family N-acetyltransferase [Moritella sp. F1]GIC82890.1 GNAT family N-acetyltransferase [Moritella sp. F3]